MDEVKISVDTIGSGVRASAWHTSDFKWEIRIMHRSTKYAVSAATVMLLCASSLTAGQSATPGIGASRETESEKKEIHDFHLTTTNLNQYERAAKAYQALMLKNPKLAKRLDEEISKAGARTIGGVVEIMGSHPPIVSAMGGSGLKIREYVVMTFTLMDAAGAVAAKQKGSKEDFSAIVSPSNMAFVELHYEKVTKALGSISGVAKDDDDDD
jgi:hypothetical protein